MGKLSTVVSSNVDFGRGSPVLTPPLHLSDHVGVQSRPYNLLARAYESGQKIEPLPLSGLRLHG